MLKNSNRIVTIVTGPIVGLNSTDFLDKAAALAEANGLKMKVFNLFDEIIDIAGIISDTDSDEEADKKYIDYVGELLNGYEYQFKMQRDNAYLSIARKMDKLPKGMNVVIRTPASIEWRGVNVILKDHRVISEYIKPDRIVTLIDAEWKIMERIKKGIYKKRLKIIAHLGDLGVEKVLQWLGSEVSVSEDWAEWAKQLTGKKVKHLVLGMNCPKKTNRKKYTFDIENMIKIATAKKMVSFYSSYSMTVATEKARKEINSLVWRLREYGVVIDPAAIEIGTNIDKKDESVVFAYTVCRDLRWDVQKVDIIPAFHPYEKKPPLSTGMMDELGHARAFKKERYVVLPSGGGSPFTRDNYVPAEHVFKSGKDFFRFIETKRKLRPQFRKLTQAFIKWQRNNISK